MPVQGVKQQVAEKRGGEVLQGKKAHRYVWYSGVDQKETQALQIPALHSDVLRDSALSSSIR